jgi:hypothetical protein
MTTLAQSYGASVALTLNSTSWAQAVVITSDAIDLSGISPPPVDVLVTVKVTFPNTAMGAQKGVNIFVAASEDGTVYDDNDQYSGSNNTQTTLRVPTNFKGSVPLAATQNVVTAITFSVRQVCGGVLPRKFGVVLENQCNQTIVTKSASYSPINYSNA